MLVLLEKYNTRKPMTADAKPPKRALLIGIVDLMVRLSDRQMENKRYAGSEQYHGIYVVLTADNNTQKT